MNKTTKRIFPILATLVLMISLLLVVALPTQAAGELTLDVNGLTATWTDASNSRGSVEWSGSGNSITGKATGYKQVSPRAVTTTLTMTNNRTDKATLSFDYVLSNGGKVISNAGTMADGKFSYVMAAGASVTITLTSPTGEGNTNTLSITNISLQGQAVSVDSTFLPATEGGSYTVATDGGEAQSVTAETKLTQMSDKPYTLVATPDSGYLFLGWYSETKANYVSFEASVRLLFEEDPQLKPVFVSDATLLFRVNTAVFTDLTEAGEFAVSSGATQINMLNSGTISGEHTIPAGVTLLVPFDAANTCYTNAPEVIPLVNNGTQNVPSNWEVPYAYRTLTLAEDAQITVQGAISVSAKHAPGNSSGQQYVGSPSGACGWIDMAAGSQIILENGAYLYAWGYIEGQGEITAKSGATVYENIQFTDFRGGGATSQMATEFMVFPMSQYYVQNIEVLTTYEAGANEYVYTSIYMSKQYFSAGVKFVGEGGMFNAVDGYVTKDYIEAKDRLAVTTSGTAQLNGLTLSVGGTSVDSSQFVLPINSNIDITIASGTTTVNQSMAMLPGSTLTVNNGAKMILASMEITNTAEGLGVVYASAHNFIIYDADNWTWGLDLTTSEPVSGNYVHAAQRIRPLSFSAANGTKVMRTAADLTDVVFDINGTVITEGYLYTTTDLEGVGNGAQIISSLKTGKLIMENGAGQDILTVQANYTNNAVVYLAIPMMSAQLRNGDGSLTDTTSAGKGTIFYYNGAEDKWLKAEEDDKIITYTWVNGDATVQYHQVIEGSAPNHPANPTKPATAQYTYTFDKWESSVDSNGNVTYTATYTQAVNSYEITWDINGDTTGEDYEYGATPAYKGETPTKPGDGKHITYTFEGWSPAISAVTGNATYTAQFKQNISDCKDENKDHECDTCGETMGEHKDTNNDHVCEYGCSVAIGTCEDANKDHTCDYGCGKTYGEHVQANLKHTCNYCGVTMSDHEGGTATCNQKAVCYICWNYYGEVDPDYHEQWKLTYTYNNDKTHTAKHPCCDADAGTEACADADNDHFCDLCNEKISGHDYSGDGTCICGRAYYLYGGYEDDTFGYNELSNYKFVDNQVTVLFDYLVYVGVRTADGTEFYLSTDSMSYTLTSSSTPGEANFFGTLSCIARYDCEVTITIVENEDGTITLSYEATGECRHSNHGVNGYCRACSQKVAHTYGDDFACSCGLKYNGVFTNSEGKIYYVENGVAVANKGLTRVVTAEGEVNYYYFGCGQESCELGCDIYTARVNCVHWIALDNGLLPQWDYSFGADGIIAHDDAYAKHDNPETALHAIVTYEDGKYYTIDGVKAYMGLFKGEDGYYYYARSSGKLAVDCNYWISKTNDLAPEKAYTFDAQGRVDLGDDLANPEDKPAENFTGIHKDSNGKMFYYENGVKTYAGLVEIDGDLYYITSSCEVKTGRYWITKTNGILPEGSYEFGEDGKMVRTTGIVEENGQKWYYQDGNKYYAGLIEIDGKYYYVNSSGLVITDKTYWISKTNNLVPEQAYYFDANGHMDMTGVNVDTETVDPDFTGIKTASDGTMYYYQNGQRYYAGLIKIDGALYYVNSKYQVVTGRYWISKTNGLMTEGSYTFGEDGKMN